MKKLVLLLFALLPVAASADYYNPECDYKDLSHKCVSVKSAKFDLEDKELNLLYKETLSVLEKIEQEDATATLVKPFINTQKDWLRYRDSFCAFDSELNAWRVSDDESIYLNKDCMADLTEIRNKQLKSIIKKYGNLFN